MNATVNTTRPVVNHHELQRPQTTPYREGTGKWMLVLGGLVLVVLAAAFTVGLLPRLHQQKEVTERAAAESAAPPRVSVARAEYREATAERVLPGNALPLMEASLYARITGYVKTRLVDIGDRVTEGQLLAVIDAPDVDDQLKQAQANLKQAHANLELTKANAVLARTTLGRYEFIRRETPGAIAPQQIDEQKATVQTTTANVEAAQASIAVNEATVQRYADLQAFEKIIAPFPGIITARNVDPGDLVTADSAARQLFHVMRTDVLRVFVNVPQVFAPEIKVGHGAIVYRREDPTKTFQGKITRTADALDPNTRTLLTEVQVPNPNNALRPGMYLQVRITIDRDVVPIVIPTAALATRSGEPRVAVLDEQSRVHYRSVQLGRDYGAEIVVIGGLHAGETVIVRPGDDLPEGTMVEPVQPAK